MSWSEHLRSRFGDMALEPPDLALLRPFKLIVLPAARAPAPAAPLHVDTCSGPS